MVQEVNSLNEAKGYSSLRDAVSSTHDSPAHDVISPTHVITSTPAHNIEVLSSTHDDLSPAHDNEVVSSTHDDEDDEVTDDRPVPVSDSLGEEGNTTSEVSDDATIVEVTSEPTVAMITVKPSPQSQSGDSENDWDDALLRRTSSEYSPVRQDRRVKNRRGRGNVEECFKALLSSPTRHYHNKKGDPVVSEDYRGCGYKKHNRGGRGLRGRGRGFHYSKQDHS